jgi:hypothetical protein
LRNGRAQRRRDGHIRTRWHSRVRHRGGRRRDAFPSTGAGLGSEADSVHDLGYYTAIFTAPKRVDLDGWFVFHPAPPGRMAGLYPVRGSDEARAMFFFTSSKLELKGGKSRAGHAAHS